MGLGADDLPAAIERPERGIACGASGEDLGALRLLEAEAHAWRGELALAEERGVEAQRHLASGTAGWFRGIQQAVIAAGKLGRLDRIEEWVEPVTSAAPASSA